MPTTPTSISPRDLKAALHDGGEIALLDAREEGAFGARHHLMATCVPLSRLELMVDDLVPRRAARVVCCDDGEGTAARAAMRLAALGYTDVAVLDGGLKAWEAEGFALYSGIHVPSKAFAEVVEHEAKTPYISVAELQAMLDAKADIVIYDSRSYEEYHNNSIPTATSVPGAELVYRFTDLAAKPETLVVVNCGGRTRSIIGAQSLISAGAPNRVVSLKDGTMAWHLAGYEVVNGATRRPPAVSAQGLAWSQAAAAKVAARCGIARIDRATLAAWRRDSERTLYLLDVRDPAEYEKGHLRGARSAPGGQLVQETDYHLATWGARVVLTDDNGVRASMTASWLKQMGWTDVSVLVATEADGDWVFGPHRPRVLGLETAKAAAIGLQELRKRLDAGDVTVVDLDLSKNYTKAHIPGAWFAVRARLSETLSKLPPTKGIVFTSSDGALASLAAAELKDVAAHLPVLALAGGTRNWIDEKLPTETGATRMLDVADDVFLMPRERGQDREAAMREYLTWEINLVNDMAKDDDQRFRLVT